MGMVTSGRAAGIAIVALAALGLPPQRSTVAAQAASSTISGSSGPIEWDYGPVVAGQFTNLGARRSATVDCNYESRSVRPPPITGPARPTAPLPAPATRR